MKNFFGISVFLIGSFIVSTCLAGIDKDIDVANVQKMLAELCFNPGPIDGDWGKKTEAAVSSFLSERGGYDGAFDENDLKLLTSAHKSSIKFKCSQQSAQNPSKKLLISQPINKSSSSCNLNYLSQLEPITQYSFENVGDDHEIEHIVPSHYTGLGIAALHSDKARKQLKKELLEHARNSSFKSLSEEISVNRMIQPLIVAYGHNQIIFSEKEQKEINVWLSDVIDTRMKFPQYAHYEKSLPLHNVNYRMNLNLMLLGIVTQDDRRINRAINTYKKAIRGMRDDGSFPNDSSRGGSSLNYQVDSLGTLITIAELAANQGYDLYAFGGDKTIAKAVNFTIDATNDSSLIVPYAKAGPNADELWKDDPKYPASNPFSGWKNGQKAEWVFYWITRFPDTPETKKIIKSVPYLKTIMAGEGNPNDSYAWNVGGSAACFTSARLEEQKFLVSGIKIAETGNFGLDKEQKREIQTILNQMGYEVGPVDGKIGSKTTEQLKKFCSEYEISLPEKLDINFLIELQNKVKDQFPLQTLRKQTDFKVTESNALIFDTAKYIYPNCKFAVEVNKHKYPRGISDLLENFGKLAAADILEPFPEFAVQDDNELLSSFSVSIYKEIAACISEGNFFKTMNDLRACDTILEIVRLFKNNAALTKSSPDEETRHFYNSNTNILIPLTLGYSAVLQKLGEPSDHNEILEWLYSAIIQNTYDVFSLENPIRDLTFKEFKCSAKGISSAAQNHSLQSGYLIGLYGALAKDERLFNFAFDRAAVTLSSIDNKGALTCEAVRGAAATSYSGLTISTLLQIFELAKLQQQNYETIPNFELIHDAAKFLLDVGENPKLIYPYAKANRTAWCEKDYRKQTECASYNGYGWIRHYMNLFPDHPNVVRIKAFADEMNTSDTMTTARKKKLSAIVKRNFPNIYIKKNIYHSDQWSKNDINDIIYDDTGNSNKGSPLCLYERELVGEKEIGKVKAKVQHSDPANSLNIWSSISSGEPAD